MRQNLRNISKRPLDIVDSLPLTNGVNILEIGCGPGTAAREIAINRALKKEEQMFIDGIRQ